MRSLGTLTALGLVSSVVQNPGAAAASTRIAVVISQDGEPTSSARELEAEIMSRLSQEGTLTFIDPERVAVLKQSLANQDLERAKPVDLVTSVDADVIVVGRVIMSELDTAGLSLHSFEASTVVRAISVDSAQVLGLVRERGIGTHLTRQSALARAISQLGEKVARKLEPKLTVGGRYVLTVDLPSRLDITEADRLIRCVETAPRVDSARSVHMDEGRLDLEVFSAADARELALHFGQDRPCGVSIHSFSSRRLGGDFQLDQSLSVEVVATRFRSKNPLAARHRWLLEQAPQILQTRLHGLPWVRTPGDSRLRPIQKATQKRKGRVVLLGTVDRTPAGFRIRAELRSTYRPKSLAVEQFVSDESEITARLVSLSETLAKSLREAVRTHPEVIPVEQTPFETPTWVSVEPSHVPGIFPAQVAAYDRGMPVATVRVTNRGKQPVNQLQLTTQVEGFAPRPRVTEPVALKPGESREVPLLAWLDREALSTHDQNQSSSLELAATWMSEDVEHRVFDSVPTMVFDRNALHWEQSPASVGAFVDHRAPEVMELARKGIASTDRATPQDPVLQAMALFHQLNGLRYVADPVNPHAPDQIDFLQYPGQTLASGGGDCDDLAVLYAAMLESVGQQAMMIRTPGHVFTAVAVPGSPVTEALLYQNPYGILSFQGMAWLPFETTQVGQSALDAWRAAAEELRSISTSGAQPDLMPVRSAWTQVPPSQFGRTRTTNETSRDSRLWEADLEALAALKRDAVATRQARWAEAESPDELNQLGIALALGGELEKAREAFQRALELRSPGPARNNLGNLEILEDRPDLALKHYERALAPDPVQPDVLLNGVLASYLVSVKNPSQQPTLTRWIQQAIQADEKRVLLFLQRLPRQADLPSAESTGTRLVGLAVRLREALGHSAAQMQTVAANGNVGAQLGDLMAWIR